MNEWTYLNKPVLSIDDMQDVEPKVWGFVYHLTLYDKKTNKVEYYYIGKKNIFSKRKRNFGKKELSLHTDKRKKKYEYIIKESDWKTYMSSNKFIKDNINKYNIKREILSFSTNDMDLSFQEAKEIMCQGALESDKYLNDGVSIRRFGNKIIN
ncbi:MAG: hypothetical protein LBM02_09910 [Lachnospiraceae bacterium]|jgi:hypothetical protein|nr:hypothetical protein [Lachnospiraceae bacterium]